MQESWKIGQNNGNGINHVLWAILGYKFDSYELLGVKCGKKFGNWTQIQRNRKVGFYT